MVFSFNLKATILSGLLLLSSISPVKSQAIQSNSRNATPPAPQREFRGVWVATVLNIDWPSKPGLTTNEQKAELIAILDRAVALKLNAVVFQVRPASDALYNSPYEPWSESLSGEMGKAPNPYYDPLEFAIEEAHKRGLELHAWFNPYRAYHAKATSPISADHISQTRPELVRRYGDYLWLDPGEKAVQDYTIEIVLDIVNRYNIDGIHMDDYFYPYPQRDEQGQKIEFPDDASWQKYVNGGGQLSRSDWRRENINVLIKRLYQTIKSQKPWVKFGVSPFGVWKPGNPNQISNRSEGQFFSAYDGLYADSRQWLQQGWLDYLSPQLYWKIEQTAQSYPVILNWWLEQNTQGRHIFPGLYTSRVEGESSQNWSPQEILYQIRTTRGFAGAEGHVHFSMKPLLQNRGNLATLLPQEVYAQPALIPASPWLNDQPPSQPELTMSRDLEGNIQLNWQGSSQPEVQLWVLQIQREGNWETKTLPRQQTSYLLTNRQVEKVSISAVSRYGIQGENRVVDMQEIYSDRIPRLRSRNPLVLGFN
ncbi:MAG: family 10 glycosylhydrolase [Cyanobacteriota bacterium]|nr:family 10 glycosylhydrolase [Cyanobacteriota bacterium]